MKRLTILHASRAAVDPVATHFAQGLAGWQITHVLDDGIMRLLQAEQWDLAVERLRRWAGETEAAYGADGVMITCSALPVAALEALKQSVPQPLIKIDEPMARAAVQAIAGRSKRIGVLSTFPATQATTRELLHWAAAGEEIVLVEEMEAEALRRLLAGDTRGHDEIVSAAAERFRGKVDLLVLAQVSLARWAKPLEEKLGMPVLESLTSSCEYWRNQR
ncbi:aspartate/glutamate racemase family protein [Nostoc sp. NIES-2111]